MKRFAYCFASLILATQLSGCAAIGGLLGTVARIPGSLFNTVKGVVEEEPAPEVLDGESLPSVPLMPEEEVVIVPVPMIDTQ